MALDRQRILTELGSVVNQLQSADCGCMGKLFNNPGQNGQIPMGNPLPTCGGCRRGCCHGHGYGGWNSGGPCGDPYTMNYQQGMQRGNPYTMNNQQVMQRGDPYTMNNQQGMQGGNPYTMNNQQGMQGGNPYTMNNQQGMQGTCMGRCNPPKLYADTYNYLTENLMQPTIKEVYNDLNSITPANAIMNNPLANQIVGSKDAFGAQSSSGGDSQYIGVPTTNMTNMSNNMESMPNNESHGQAMGHMSGMGPQIMNMLGTNQVSKPSTIRSDADQGRNQLTGSMLIDAPQSPHGAVGVTPLSAPMRNNEGIYTNNNVIGFQNPDSNHYNNFMGKNIPETIPTSQNISNMKTNPAAQQMDSSHHHRHGMHNQGIAKFNEMFPGVMKGLGGDLKFDPMALAIQMNPANHHRNALESMQKIMTNNNRGVNEMLDKTGHTNATPEQPGSGPTNNSNVTHNQPNVPQVQNVTSEQVNNQNIIPAQNSNLYGAPEKNQQIYSAVTQQPISQHQIGQQHLQQQPQQPIVDPNSGNVIPSSRLPTHYEGALGNGNDTSRVTNQTNVISAVPVNQQMIKEPIFPADISKSYVHKQKRYEYNTLGQPIEMLPAQVYHTREPALPQTLSPQPQQRSPNNAARFSNVKSTVSKTSLMHTRNLDRTASKSQLQHIYNQYKGSQSYTQHNVKAPDTGASYSDGKLNVPRTNVSAAQPNIPIERVGGDALANNQIQDQRTNKVEQVIGQIGDVPGVIKPTGDITNPQVTNKKTRNGLQDQVYTSYPTSAAWSFHGDGAPRYTSGCRSRYRV